MKLNFSAGWGAGKRRCGTTNQMTAAWAAVLALNCALCAQEAPPEGNQAPTLAGGSQEGFASPTSFVPRDGAPRVIFSVDGSYVGAGQAKFEGAKLGNSDAEMVGASLAGAVPINERWFVPLGVSSANIFLEPVPGTPIPSEIHTLRLFSGLGYKVNDQWTVGGSVGPDFYKIGDVTTSGIGVAGTVHAIWQVRGDLTVAFGVAIVPDLDIPVLPAAGVRWDIRTNLTLNLMFPRPIIIYRAAPRLNFFAGADFKFALFRADNDQGTRIGQPSYNNGLGTYRDIHLGAGVEYRIARGLWASAEGGYSVAREIDYKRIGQTIDFDPGPYVQAGLKYRF